MQTHLKAAAALQAQRKAFATTARVCMQVCGRKFTVTILLILELKVGFT